MTTVGESSGAQEEVFTDIPIDTEQLVGYTPVAPVAPSSESEQEEDYLMDLGEPVVGGVLRSGSQDSDGESEEDPTELEIGGAAEEVPEEGSPVFHTFQDDLLGDYADRIIEQEHIIDQRDARIAHLEEQNAVHQDREEQYKTLAYQLTDKNTELEDRVRDLQEENHDYQNRVGQYESLVHHLVTRNAELSVMHQEAEQKRVELQAENEALKAEFDLEIADKIRIEEAWSRSATRVDHLEGEVRAKKARMDSMSYAFFTGFGRWRDRVSRYPAEEGQTHHTISRQLVDYIGRQEYDDAVQRGMLG